MKIVRSILVLALLALFQISCGGGGGGGGTTMPTAPATPQEVISNLKDAAAKEDLDKMADNFHQSNRDAYKADLETAKNAGFLRKLAEALQTAQVVYIKNNYAKYKVQVTENGEVITFYIYLIKDTNGNWKIWSV